MDTAVLNLIKLQNQLRVLHWQTESFAEHKAFGKSYDALDGLIDQLVEVFQGKYGRIKFPKNSAIEISNYKEIDAQEILDEATAYLSSKFAALIEEKKDTDCLNIRDDMLSEINRLKYLLTLK